MAQETEEQQETTEQNGDSGESNGGHGGAVRAAAIAAATGATAFAAKKAFSSRQHDESDDKPKERRSRGGDDESMFGTMLTSGWHAAKDSLLPFAEDAAGAAGEWIGREGPELVRETLVPRFIRGFEKTRKSSSDDDAD